MIMQCDNAGCRKSFELRPDSIATAIEVDKNCEPIDYIPAEHVFICPACDARFAFEAEDEA